MSSYYYVSISHYVIDWSFTCQQVHVDIYMCGVYRVAIMASRCVEIYTQLYRIARLWSRSENVLVVLRTAYGVALHSATLRWAVHLRETQPCPHLGCA